MLGVMIQGLKKSFSVSVCIMVTVESLISACVKKFELPFCLYLYVIVRVLRQFQGRRMVDVDLELCWRFVL